MHTVQDIPCEAHHAIARRRDGSYFLCDLHPGHAGDHHDHLYQCEGEIVCWTDNMPPHTTYVEMKR